MTSPLKCSLEGFLCKELRVVSGYAKLLCGDRAQEIASPRRVPEAVTYGTTVSFGDGEEMRGIPCAILLPDGKDEAQLSRALLELHDPVRPRIVLGRLFNEEVDSVVVALDLLQ